MEPKRLTSWWWFIAFAVPFLFIVASIQPPYSGHGVDWGLFWIPAALLVAVVWFIAYRRWP
jgi:hypothetical protein